LVEPVHRQHSSARGGPANKKHQLLCSRSKVAESNIGQEDCGERKKEGTRKEGGKPCLQSIVEWKNRAKKAGPLDRKKDCGGHCFGRAEDTMFRGRKTLSRHKKPGKP